MKKTIGRRTRGATPTPDPSLVPPGTSWTGPIFDARFAPAVIVRNSPNGRLQNFVEISPYTDPTGDKVASLAVYHVFDGKAGNGAVELTVEEIRALRDAFGAVLARHEGRAS